MKKLLIKILTLVVMVAILSAAAHVVLYRKIPFSWGDKYLQGKRNYLQQNTNKFNTLFIGSSKTHYEVAPKQFDAVVNAATGANIHSYNFGVDGMLPPESFYICKQLLQHDSLQLKNIIIELDYIKAGDTNNLFTWRGFYWVNPETYSNYTSTLMHSQASAKFKAWNFAVLNVAAFQKFYNVGAFNAWLDYRQNQTVTDSTARYAGFEPLVRQAPFYEQKLTEINKVKEDSRQAFYNFDAWSNAAANTAFQKQLMDLAAIAQQKGIKVYYLFPSQWSIQQYQELLPILKALPPDSKIIMANVAGHEPVFNPANLYDAHHTNADGARIYTDFVARQFVKLLQK